MSTAANRPTDDFSHCHISIINNFEQLCALGRADISDPVQPEIQATAKKLLSFYHDVVVKHHHEEEQELFNIVLDCASPGKELQKATQMITRLTKEHRQLEKAWESLEGDIKKLSTGSFALLDKAAAVALAEAYLLHARYEESFFLPLTADILKNTELEPLGLSLHNRHNINKAAGYI